MNQRKQALHLLLSLVAAGACGESKQASHLVSEQGLPADREPPRAGSPGAPEGEPAGPAAISTPGPETAPAPGPETFPTEGPETVPTFAASRHPAIPIHELLQSWYCRWGLFEAEGGDDPLQKRQDARWEQRVLDIFSWDSFLALNWPHAHQGGTWRHAPAPAGKEYTPDREYLPRWGSWWTSWDVLERVKTPGRPWLPQRPGPDGWRCEGACLAGQLKGQGHDGDDVVWDQNGERVYYEVRVNESWIETIARRKLDAGEPRGARRLSFTWGQCKKYFPKRVLQDSRDQYDFAGAVEIKLAWKILGERDARERFYTMSGVVPEPGRAPVDLGLVGMHIMTKSKTQTKYVWSTFEHVDNVRANPLAGGGLSRPSFHDPGCADCCANQRPTGRAPVQLARIAPIDADTDALNREVRAWLAAQGSVWQHYELVGTQYTRMGGDEAVPAELRNTLIEPYFVPRTSCMAEGAPAPASSCIGCHEHVEPYDFSFLARDLWKAARARGGPRAR